MPETIAKDDLIADFKRVADELETEPTLEEYIEHGEYSQTPIYRLYDSYSELTEKVDYERSRFWIDKEDLRDDLKRVAEKLGRTPKAKEYDEHGEYSVFSVHRQFGTYNDGIRAIGHEPTLVHNISEDEIISEIKRLCGDERPTTEDMEKRGKYSLKAFYNTFDTWGDALEAAGYERRVTLGKRITLSCEVCGDEFEVTPGKTDRMLCSKDCQYERLSNLMSGDGHFNATERIEHECTNCGEIFERVPWRSREANKVYCSSECMYDWLSVEGKFNYGEGWNEEKRETVREMYDRTCQGCGLSGSVNKKLTGMKLHVHHIIPARQFDSPEPRNAVDNLIPLCVSCHGEWEGIPLKPQLID
jgi:5-methylcytosine-specific restriction endonuclease McrA